MFKDKPTVDDILDLYDDVKKRYEESGIWSQFERDWQLYEGDFLSELNLPAEHAKYGVILPTARDLLDACVDHTDVFYPRVWVGRKGESTKSRPEREALRRLGLGIIHRNNVEATISPYQVSKKHFWGNGVSFIKTVYDADRYIDKPERKDGESDDAYADRIDTWRSDINDSIPIRTPAIPPRHMLVDPYHDPPEYMFEVREQLLLNMKQYRGWSNPKGHDKAADKVEWASFWSKDYRCELFDREPVLKVKSGVAKHTYGFIPYVEIDTGLGNVTFDNDMCKRYVGILKFIETLLISESRDYSIGDVILAKNAWPWGYLKGPNAKLAVEISQKLGEYSIMPEGVEIIDMVPKLPPDALLTWMSVTSQAMATHAAPRSVQGLGEQGVRSAADRRLIIAQAATRYVYANIAYEHGIAKVLSNCARIMKNVVPGNIFVWARGKTPNDEFDIEVRKEDMKEPFTYYVEFGAQNEEDEYRRQDSLIKLTSGSNPIATVDWAREQMSNMDATAMKRQQMKDYVLQQLMPQIAQYANAKFQVALSELQGAEALTTGAAPSATGPGQPPVGQPQQPAQPQEPGRSLAPPIPERAQPGSMEEMANQNRANLSVRRGSQGLGGGGQRP